MKKLLISSMVAVTLLVSSLMPVHASTKGRRNTTIALGAVTAYGLVKKKKKVAIVGAVGTAYAYSRYRKSKKNDRRRAEARRIHWYKSRYGRSWRNYYKPGK
jgi:chromate transport protein ChrA